ncbi:MAG: hypothetical protein K2Q12_09385 [Rickettsiales bacterium]|nr:hypothetical protein [Rickettsiales bacterium]
MSMPPIPTRVESLLKIQSEMHSTPPLKAALEMIIEQEYHAGNIPFKPRIYYSHPYTSTHPENPSYLQRSKKTGLSLSAEDVQAIHRYDLDYDADEGTGFILTLPMNTQPHEMEKISQMLQSHGLMVIPLPSVKLDSPLLAQPKPIPALFVADSGVLWSLARTLETSTHYLTR